MPRYDFINDKTGEIKEVIQGMNAVHEHFEDGVQWRRLFTIPQAAINTKFDAFSEKDFVRNTDNKKGPISDIWDRSAEYSAKREQKEGRDAVKEKYFAKEKRRRNGKPCGAEIEARANKVIKI